MSKFKNRDTKYHCTSKVEYMLLLAAMVFGFIIRIAGFKWGGYSIYQPDEVWMVSPAVTLAIEDSYTHDTFYYPAQSFAKVQAILIKSYSKISGYDVSYLNVSAYWICRLVVVMSGTLTIALVFFIGNKLKDKLGTVSALFIAVSPIMVNMSKQDTGDVNVLFCGALTMLFALKYSERQQYKYLFLMAASSAIGMMEKWHGGIDIALAGLFVLLYATGVIDFIKRGFFTLLSFIACLFIIAPNMIFQLKSVIVDGFFGVAIYDGEKGPGFIGNLLRYIGWSYEHIGGLLFVLAIVIGLILVVKQRDKRYCVLLIGVMKLLILCTMNRSFARWGLEFYLTVVIVAAMPIAELINSDKKYSSWIASPWAAVIGVEALLCSIFVCEVATHGENDIRARQEIFCEEKGINLDNSISAYYTCFMPGGIRSAGTGEFDSYNMGNVIEVVDGELYKKVNADYYIFSDRSSSLSVEDVKLLENVKIWEEKPVYNDISSLPYAGLKSSINDIILVINDINGISDIRNGAVIGNHSIRIYDISDLSVIGD